MTSLQHKTLRLGTRGSRLALWQAHHVRDRILAAHPDCGIEIVTIKTLGDQVRDVPLHQVGGQGLFIKEIEAALTDGRIDIAVHSLKDVPHAMADGLVLGAISAREDPRDALLSRNGAPLATLPANACIGTSSLRRQAQLLQVRPDLRFTALRGNVDTRLAKLSSGELDAIVLATAGLTRLQHAQQITEILPVTTVIPAAGQGLLAVQCRATDLAHLRPLLDVIEDARGRLAATGERAFMTRLLGGCSLPMAVHAEQPDADTLVLHAFLGLPDGTKKVRETRTLRLPGSEQASAAVTALGHDLADSLLAGGGTEILRQLGRRP